MLYCRVKLFSGRRAERICVGLCLVGYFSRKLGSLFFSFSRGLFSRLAALVRLCL